MEEWNQRGWEGTGEERVSGAKGEVKSVWEAITMAKAMAMGEGEEQGGVGGCEEEEAETATNRRVRYIGV